MVVELYIKELDTWWSFMADRLPDALDDAIKGNQLKFMEAQKLLTAEEIKDQLPVVFPSTHVMDKDVFPGVSRFPIDEWKKAGEPCLSVSGWAALAMKIAEKDLDNLDQVFTVAKRFHKEHEKAPSQAAATVLWHYEPDTLLDQPIQPVVVPGSSQPTQHVASELGQPGSSQPTQHVVSQLGQLEEIVPVLQHHHAGSSSAGDGSSSPDKAARNKLVSP